MYVMCIWLIYGNLGCDVDLLRSFVILGGLPVYISESMCVSTCLAGRAVLDLV
jgi:hypothetical protein